MPDRRQPGLTKPEILSAFERLNQLLEAEGIVGEISLFGGTVMVLVFNARISTRDVDAVFQPASLIRKLARQVAEEREFPEGWLNDGVKGFESARPETTTAGVPQYSHLRVVRPTAEYLLAMKCMAARAADPEDTDRQDIRTLVRHLELNESEAVLAIVERFFPPGRILPKTQFMIHEVMATLQEGT